MRQNMITIVALLLFLFSSCNITTVGDIDAESSALIIESREGEIEMSSRNERREQQIKASQFYHEHYDFGYIIKKDQKNESKEAVYSEIERFVFFRNIDDVNFAFIVDGRYGLIYTVPLGYSMDIDYANNADYYFQLMGNDIIGLHQTLEDANFHTWKDEYYATSEPEPRKESTFSEYWAVGVQYKDGTIENYEGGGSGHGGTKKGSYPEGYFILKEYIESQVEFLIEERENIKEEELAKAPKYPEYE